MKALVILLLTIVAIVLRLTIINERSVPFPQDMGRDLLWTKDISYYSEFTLIGPAASIWGVYFGPFWYYFLAIPLYLSNGNPLSAVLATMVTLILTAHVAYFFYKKYLKSFYISSLFVLLLFSSIFINLSIFAFHANLLPILTLLTLIFSFMAVVKNPTYISIAFLSSSLMFSADPAPAVVSTVAVVFIYFWFKQYKRHFLKTVTLSIFLYVLPLVPQIIFEIRNNFTQTKSLIAYFKGDNPSLSGQLPLLERIPNRIILFFDFIKDSFFVSNTYFAALSLILLSAGTYLFYKKNHSKELKTIFAINLIFTLLTFLILTFLVTVEVKSWYLFGLSIPMVFLMVFSLMGFKNNRLASLSLLILVLVNIYRQFNHELVQNSKNDPANLNNQMAALGLIYEDENLASSVVYIFTPSVYDLNYQYLFWWQGVLKKRGLPQDFAYLPDKPPYVRNKEIYSVSNKAEPSFVYLIIEKSAQNEFYTSTSWLNNFNGLNILWEKDINSAIVVQKRAIPNM